MIAKAKLLLALAFCTIVSFVTSAQECNTSLPLSTPDSRFTLNNNGTAIDSVTGLEWARCAVGQNLGGSLDDLQCFNTPSLVESWDSAVYEAQISSFAGHNDWRLPNIKELYSIVETACYPALNTNVFKFGSVNVIFMWTSTIGSNGFPYKVITMDGLANSDSDGSGPGMVVLVRDPQ